MEKLPRLNRSQIVARLREHAAKHGFVSTMSLHTHDPDVLRSIPRHFVGLSAARIAADVPGPPYQKPRTKTGPKKGSKPSHVRPRMWSRKLVLQELRRIQREEGNTALNTLLAGGHTALVRFAHAYAGGLREARRLARVPQPTRGEVPRKTYSKQDVAKAIRDRRKKGQSLAFTHLPAGLYAAARRHYGSWPAALGSLGIDSHSVRAGKKYTKEVIIARLKAAARDGSDLLSVSLAPLLDLKAVNREFGTLAKALHAAGLAERLRMRRHGGTKWTHERVIAALRERAARNVHTLTPGLHRVVQLYFGGAREARQAAGVPDPVDVAIERRKREKAAFQARHRRPAKPIPRR